MHEIKKFINEDGKVGILISPGFGAGWWTWNQEYPEMIFDPEIIEAVLTEDYNKAKVIAEAKYPNAYLEGMRDICVEFLEPGTSFIIEEYDGSESIRTYSDLRFIA